MRSWRPHAPPHSTSGAGRNVDRRRAFPRDAARRRGRRAPHPQAQHRRSMAAAAGPADRSAPRRRPHAEGAGGRLPIHGRPLGAGMHFHRACRRPVCDKRLIRRPSCLHLRRRRRNLYPGVSSRSEHTRRMDMRQWVLATAALIAAVAWGAGTAQAGKVEIKGAHVCCPTTASRPSPASSRRWTASATPPPSRRIHHLHDQGRQDHHGGPRRPGRRRLHRRRHRRRQGCQGRPALRRQATRPTRSP